MNFGDRDDMLKLAEKRLAEAKKKHPKAQLVDADSVRVIFLTADDPTLYSPTLMADAGAAAPRGYTRQELFAGLLKPVKRVLG
jgi:formate dehydrogenase iron-sulfur subunit